MSPAEGQLHMARLGKGAIAGIAIHLQSSPEALEMGDWPLGLATGRVDISNQRRPRSAPGSIIAGVGPELTGLGASSTGHEYRRRRLIGEPHGRGPHPVEPLGV